jgi:hypothetical protein
VLLSRYIDETKDALNAAQPPPQAAAKSAAEPSSTEPVPAASDPTAKEGPPAAATPLPSIGNTASPPPLGLSPAAIAKAPADTTASAAPLGRPIHKRRRFWAAMGGTAAGLALVIGLSVGLIPRPYRDIVWQ